MDDDQNSDNESLAGPLKTQYAMKFKLDTDKFAMTNQKSKQQKTRKLLKDRLATNIPSNGFQY